jgi:hypothetical protein
MSMPTSIIVNHRFNGPPHSAQGGYICGLIAKATGENVRVRLFRPPSLDKEFVVVERPPDEWRVTEGKDTIATAVKTHIHVHVPDPPPYVQAMDASLHFAGFKQEIFATCFVCGHHRQRPDGLRVFPGHVPGGLTYAAPWVPTPDLTDASGKVKPDFFWSGLECAG